MEQIIDTDKLIDNNTNIKKKESNNGYFFDCTYCCFIFLSILC